MIFASAALGKHTTTGKKDDRNYGNGVKIKQCTVVKAFRVSRA